VLWIHLLGMAFFVGGQLMLAGILVPVLRGGSDPQPLRRAARRFGIGTLIALAVQIATGGAMATHNHQWGSSTLQIKLGLVVLVGVLIVVHMRRTTWHALEGAIFLVSLAIVWCGVLLANS
jgi:putative copper export protein